MKKYLKFENVEKLNDSEFNKLINDLFENIANIKIKYEDAITIWNNIYKDIIDRTHNFDDFSIISLHEEYLKLINTNKQLLKNYTDIPSFVDIADLERYLHQNMINEDNTLHNFKFKLLWSKSNNYIDGRVYEYLNTSSIKDEGRGILTDEYTFTAGSVHHFDSMTSVRIVAKSRYIKTKDKLILKELKNISLS